LEPLEDFEKER
jgi:hypothetical protein